MKFTSNQEVPPTTPFSKISTQEKSCLPLHRTSESSLKKGDISIEKERGQPREALNKGVNGKDKSNDSNETDDNVSRSSRMEIELSKKVLGELHHILADG
ncbi:hypothetical protein HAX54_013318, partial [Datura stramonium]|nr:hypothetical protein [Datura stramonium]